MKCAVAARRSQRGSVAVITGLTIAVLIGFLGLSVDLGRLFVIKAELQTAMDSCALAAASQLRPGTGSTTTLDRAIAYGKTPPNRANFQGQLIDPNNIQFSFSDTLAGPYTSYSGGGNPALANSARYARCTYPLANVPVLFMRVLNSVTETSVGATAVATLAPSQTNCGFPVAVCREPTATAPDYGLAKGQWVGGLGSVGGGGGGPNGCTAGTGTGNFCWIDFSPPAGGASELSTLIQGQGQCDLEITNPIGQTGVVASLVDAWNTRFGIYPPGGGSGNNITNAPPDWTGYAYNTTTWPAQFNAYGNPTLSGGALAGNFVSRRDAFTPFNSDSGITINPSQPISSGQHHALGRDRRVVLAPVMNCSQFATTQTIQMDRWACVLLLAPISNPGGGSFSAKLEFLGMADEPGTPCATTGLGGGSAGPLVPVLVQ